LGLFVVVRHSKTRFHQKGGSEDVVPIDARAICLLDAGAHEGAAGSGAAGSSEYGSLEDHRALEAEAAAEAVLIAQAVVDLAVRVLGVLGERQQVGEVIGGR
jgi:hypothetical protein